METIYSKFWLDEDINEFSSLLDDKTELLSLSNDKNDKLLYLSKVRTCIKNLICVYTGKDIDVQFKTKDNSYTDGNTVVLSAKIYKNNLDSTVGLALHEATHITDSDFLLIMQIMVNKKKSTKIPQHYYDESKKIGYDESDVNKFVKLLTNWIEDRRIDDIAYKRCPGYNGYYHALYNRYFYNEIVSTALESPLYRKENMESYYYRIINIINPNTDLYALKGLKKIYDELDLNNIHRLLESSDSLVVALSVYDIILQNVKESKEEQKKPDSFGDNDDGEGDDTEESEDDEENTNQSEDDSEWDPDADIKLSKNKNSGKKIDWDKLSEKQKNQIKEQISEMLKEQTEMIDSDGNSDKTDMSIEDKNKVDLMSETNSKIKTLNSITPNMDIYDGKKYEVIVMKNIKESDFFSSDYPFRSRMIINSDAVSSGIVLGKILANKLKIRNEERQLVYNRMDNGKIDKRRLSSHVAFGSSSIFKQVFTEKYTNAILHISLDISVSMNGKKLHNAITMITSICYASNIIKNMDVVVSLRGTHIMNNNHKKHDDDLPMIAIIYDSRIDKFSKLRNILPYIDVCGGTPEGLCYDAIQDEILSSNKIQKSYFCNLGDGEPYFSKYTGVSAAKHTASQVNKMRQRGIKILSYYIKPDEQEKLSGYYRHPDPTNFKIMYGKDAKFIEPNDIVSIAKTLNDLFIEDKY